MITLCHGKEDVKLGLEKNKTTSSRTHTSGQLRSSHGVNYEAPRGPWSRL
jgi:hypothetical protein